MTKQEKEFIEWDINYKNLYDWLKAKLGKKAVTIHPESNSLYVETRHFGVRISLSFNETKFWINTRVPKDPTDADILKTYKKSFRFFQVETVAAFFEQLLEVENFIEKNEG